MSMRDAPIDILMTPLFKIGDIIASDWDKPSLIIEIKRLRGFVHYKAIRQDPEDIKVNGTFVHYSQLSVAGFKVVGHNPAAQVLYSTKES